MIVYITIGNSDDKLSQAEWSRLAGQVSELLHPSHGLTSSLIGAWFSLPHEPWQNACWCVEIEEPYDKPYVNVLKRELKILAEKFRQDSIVFAVANVEFLARPETTTRQEVMNMAEPLTVESFIENFRRLTGWKCEPGTRITNDLTTFATERLGSTRDIQELHVIFCISHGIPPTPNPNRNRTEATS